jgi:hypothetical protein
MASFLYVSLVLVLIWLALFFFSKGTRREQIIMSIVGLVLSPAAILVASLDYRNQAALAQPIISIEDLLFAFALFGIAAVIYQAIFGKHAERAALASQPKRRASMFRWAAELILILCLWISISVASLVIFHLTSIQSVIVGGLLIGIYMIASRKDLLTDALLSGLFVAILIFLTEQLFFVRLFPEVAAEYWNVKNLSGISLAGVPLEEVLWSGIVGFTIGPVYEYVRRWKLR